jgi:membrane-associated phospholipid phosphatase
VPAWLALAYPAIVFVVIPGTGNHHVLDTLSAPPASQRASLPRTRSTGRWRAAPPWRAGRASSLQERVPAFSLSHQRRLHRRAGMSARSVLSQRPHPHLPARRRRSGDEPTRHEWVRELLLVVAGLLVYFGVRAATDDKAGVAVAHARSLMRLEHALGIARERDFQDLVIHHHWLVTLANWVYIWGHWPLIAVSAAWLFRRRFEAYRRMRTAIFISGAIGMIVFLAYPVAPPRLTGLGLTDTVTSYSHAYRALQPPSLIDRYAALPSLHFGWDLLVGLTLARFHPRTIVRILGALMPVAMGVAVVVTANHYVLDVIVGGIVSMIGLALANLVIHKRDKRDERAQASAAGAVGKGSTWPARRC